MCIQACLTEAAGCYCDYPYVRSKNGDCVLEEECAIQSNFVQLTKGHNSLFIVVVFMQSALILTKSTTVAAMVVKQHAKTTITHLFVLCNAQLNLQDAIVNIRISETIVVIAFSKTNANRKITFQNLVLHSVENLLKLINVN